MDPADRVTLDESVNMAFLVLLESMTPAERVAFILHDVSATPSRRSRTDGAVVAVLAFDVIDGRITRIWAIRNPEKLRPWTE